MLTAMISAGFPAPPTDGVDLFGPLSITFYAVCILVGAALAVWLASRLWASRGGAKENVFDATIWAVLLGFIGARLYHVVTSPDAYFGPEGELSRIPEVWNGGLSIIGAVIFGALGVWIACRRYGIRFGAFTDVLVPGVLLAQAVGRWGNWFNQELYGAPTNLPWGLVIDTSQRHQPLPLGAGADTAFHPTFFYEFVWNLIGVALLLWLFQRFQFKRGLLTWSYVAYYALGRFWVESLRIDESGKSTQVPLSDIGIEWRLNQIIMFVIFLVALAMLIWLWAKRPRTEEELEEEMRIYAPEQEASEQADSAEDAEADSAEAGDEAAADVEDSADAEEKSSPSTS
ncbi:prolipoprotein diacylglyceryl transferase [Nesterenkonia lacusekhoensis]|uniref:Phosphatidylglycerol--prolipoprotein diacylglyceryl transferase n=1 Tax=Nesterenkonia lacusekhoensis TaxID=150832 RepID=A0ABS4T1Q5_9MICC|nr:prolipoprotein diacylglyceryl transferase [Nesterenkonia lacusekhoensis]MBP2318381.1 prolipoprotein diacylglyceryl transferase [Nesterenkonia lacusekhoensis]